MVEKNSNVVIDILQCAGFLIELQAAGYSDLVETKDGGAFVMLGLFIPNSPPFERVSDYIITKSKLIRLRLGALARFIGLNCALTRSLWTF